MSMSNHVAVIGGDKRQFYMCKLLSEDNIMVDSFGVDMKEAVLDVTIAESIEQIMELCDVIIGPIPFSRDGIHFFSNVNPNIALNEFNRFIRSNHIIIGGNMNDKIIDRVKEQNGRYFDFMKEDSIAVKNAIATAEGTIAEAIKLSDINLYESKCLILGYGRCAKALAARLKSLGANVTIAARNREQRLLARNESLEAINLKDIHIKLPEFDFIFNSIPAMILTAQWLQLCKQEAVIVDIASKPGGTDFEECKRLGLKATLSLGLPGKYSPRTSAEILIQSIRHLLPH
ncbi:dipicolinate synthase subunit A [Lachnotalea glycerini]|uniref:Dipicolinate synthase subunit A n=1 Tax=Lachnotalea glycerini TaxID=1763509 RepID=A0A318EW77_9FIRM|nr:dipicolinate synthase subunit DpsA [Lachnotalea glycerini]PXV95497.1 dipicolinate synthase subunit A [Lachnotalea glycerini]RDY32817.1 dipicolinate synthase subunit DpsA [Lachnotalea glycerini]